MSLLDPYEIPAIMPAEALQRAVSRKTGFGEYLGAKFYGGGDYSITGRALDSLFGVSESEGPLPSDGTTREQAAAMGFDVDQRRITEEEWKKLRLDRPGLEFSGGGTVEYENARTRDFDERRYRDSLIQRYEGSVAAYAAGFGAALLGAAPSPENFVPFLPQAVRAGMVARLGVIGGRAAGGAADAALGTAIADALILPDLTRRGEDVGVADLALDVTLGAVLGTALGGGAGVLQARQEARQALARLRDAEIPPEAPSPALAPRRPAGEGFAPIVGESLKPHPRSERLPTDPDAAAARAVRMDGVERQADALEVAMRDLADDEPVAVGPILEGADTAISRRLSTSLAPQMEAVATPPLPQPTERAFTASGRAVDVSYEVVEADSLVASNLDDLQPNPAFPAELQPRDRTRAASAGQIQAIAANLQPELLGRSATAADGAPIIGADNVVESGNARVLALRRAYGQDMPGAKAYRQFLASQGYEVEGMKAPALVRRRAGDLTPEQRAEFALEANQRTVAAMGTAERALADARSLDDALLSQLDSADLYAAANRKFVLGFVDRLPQSERGDLMTGEGKLAKAGADRIRTAVLARAYGDADLVERLAEEPESGLGPMGAALVDVAPLWAKMRVEAAAGTIAAEGDGTAPLLEAVRAVVRERDAGNPLHFALTQGDMLGGGMSVDGGAFLGDFLTYDKKGNSRLIGRQKLTDLLGRYVAAARGQQPGIDMFGEPPALPREILAVFAGREVDPKPARMEVKRLVEQGASLDQVMAHPVVKRALMQIAALEPTDTPDGVLARKFGGYLSDQWKAEREFNFKGEKVVGFDAAVARLVEGARAFAEGPVTSDRRAFIVLGPPAAGKSTLAEELARRYRAAIVDPDEAKAVLPEYKGGIGANAVHEESSAIAELILDGITGAGNNLIFPKVGGKVGSIRKTINTLTERGYRVGVINMGITYEEAFRRMFGRYASSGRLINPEYIVKEVGDNPTRTYMELRDGREADGFAEVDSMGPPGATPKEAAKAVAALGELDQPRGGRRSDVGSVGGEVAPGARAPTAERGAEGFDQLVIPGAERTAQQALDARAGRGLAARRPQLAADEGLFAPAADTRQTDWVTQAAEPAPARSVVEAEASVNRAPPKDGQEEVARLAEAMGVEDAGELADLEVLRRDGLLTARDESELADADELVKEANGWAAAYETLATCVLRYGQ